MRRAGAVMNLLLAGLFVFLGWRSRVDGNGWWWLFTLAAVFNVVAAVVKFRGPAPLPPFGPPGQGTVAVELRMEGDRVLEAVKALREAVPGLGLKEAKDAVDAARRSGSATLTTGASPEQREAIRRALAESGSGLTVV